jgi:signal peptidase II
LYHSINVIPGFFDLTHVHNPGGAFGIFAQSSKALRQFFFLALTSVAIIMIFMFYRSIPRSHPWLSFGLALIFGGALGNLIDRVRMGEVVDFLKFYVGRYQWPSFNIADSAVTIGVGIFIAHLVFGKMPDNWR